MRSPARVRPGFTLVEVLTALAVFAVIAAAGAAVLAASIDNRFAVRTATERAGALQRTHALLKADLGQATTRRTRDRHGEPQALALAGATAPGDPLLVVTRAGWSQASDAGRPSLQRVEYRLAEGRLERRASPYPDGSRPGPPQALYEGVSDVRLTFLRGGRETANPTPDLAQPLPDAVRLTMTLEGYGPMTQLFPIGGGR